MKVLDLFDVRSFDGCNARNHLFYTSDEDVALAWVHVNTYDAYERVTITIFDTLDEFEARQKEKLIATALSKLTDSERRAIGFS